MAGCVQEAKVASGAPSSHRVPPAAIPFQDRLRHLQPLLYHMTVAKRNMFVQTAFAPALSSHRVQKQAQQDCMRLHASMWGAAAVSKSASAACCAAFLRRHALPRSRCCGLMVLLVQGSVHPDAWVSCVCVCAEMVRFLCSTRPDAHPVAGLQQMGVDRSDRARGVRGIRCVGPAHTQD